MPTLLETPSPAAANPLVPGGPMSHWQRLCLLLVALSFGLLLARHGYREEADATQTVSCEVIARGPAQPKAGAALEITLSYDWLDRGPRSFRVPATAAGSAGELCHYEFPIMLRRLGAISLRGPGPVETVRLYSPDGRPLVRLAAGQFHVGAPMPDNAALVILHPPRDGSAPLAWGVLGNFPMPAEPAAAPYLAGWGAFYTAMLLGLAWLVGQLFGPGRSLDLRRATGGVETWSAFLVKTRPLQVGLALALAVAMAVVSAVSANPDEYQHVAAARFYRHGGWLPPAMGDPRVRDAIGPNGLSYFQDIDFVYLFAGKVAHLTGLFTAREEMALRLVNLGLFAALAALAVRRGGASWSWILLVCPQAWYTFSYFNGDAMGLFLSVLLVLELAGPDTALHRYLGSDRPRWGAAAGLGLLVGLIAISKKNYFPIVLLAPGFALWQLGQAADWPARRRLAARWAVIGAVALGVYVVRVGYDETLYGFHKAERLRETAEALATPEYRPSSVLNSSAHWYMDLRGRGVSLPELMTHPRWRDESFMSFTGLYGWMTIIGPQGYYQAMQYLYLAFAGAMLFEYLRGASRADLALLGVCLAMVGVTFVASFYYSWVVNFQPQGRYLFPILPLLALLALRRPRAVRAPLPALLGLLIFGLAVYSFVAVGLLQIPR